MSEELSMNEKTAQAHDIAVGLGERLNAGTLKAEETTVEIIWGHADGLSAKRLWDLRDGRCSLQASIDFDVMEEELELDSEIRLMSNLIAR